MVCVLFAFQRSATNFIVERIVEPLHDKYKQPYYHRKLNRVPELDECVVNDLGCFYEANNQFRLDKYAFLVSSNIKIISIISSERFS